MGFGHADGAISWLNVSDAPILDQSGTIAGVVSTFADITERKQAEEALHLHTERLEILREIDQSILAAQSPETIAEVTLSRIRQLIPCQRTDILLYDSSSNGLLVLAVDAAVETKVREGAYASFERFADEIDVLRQDKVVILEEFRPRGKVTTAMYAEGVRSLVGVPMICQDELIGSLNFGMNTDALTFEHIDIARHVADSLAVAIQQARLYEQVKRQADELEQRVADRTRELSVLYKVAALASQSLGLETTLARSLEQVLEVVKSDAGAIHLLDETDGPADKKVLRLAIQQGISPDLVTRIESLLISEGLGEWLAERNKPFTVPGTTSILQVPMGPHAYVGMPLRASGRTLGTLSIARRSNQPQFNVEEFSLLTSVADQLGVVVEGARLRERAEQAAVFEERERLARELHDRVVQSLYSLTLFAEWGRDLFEDGELKAAKQRLVRIGETAHQALKEMRLLVYELRPALLEQDGLVKALQQRLDAVEKRSGVKVSLQARSVGRLPAPVEEGLYRIAQEALNNALKHAAASLVTLRVSVENDGEQVIMEIKDDGMGFMPDAVSHRGGLGLDSMRERAKRLGSELVVVSTPGEGTKVIVTVEVS